MAAGEISQHQALPTTVPIGGDGLTAAVVVATQNQISDAYNEHDADGTIHFLSGTLAQRPAFGTAGRKYVTTDTPRVIFVDTGTGWVELDYAPAGPTQADQKFYLYATRI